MSILRGLTALGFAFLLALAPAPIPRALAKSVKDILAEVKRNPMKFYVAKGKPGACGPGCSDWIAAEGNVDPDAHDRFKLFLVSLPNTRLPVFINSKGGAGPVARKIGDMLREHGMAAAVGRTISVSRGSRHNLVFHGAKTRVSTQPRLPRRKVRVILCLHIDRCCPEGCRAASAVWCSRLAERGKKAKSRGD